MSRTVLLAVGALALSLPLFSQGFSSYLPAKSAPKAAKLLASIDDYSAAISAQMNASREEQLKAESDSVEVYALIRSSTSSRSAWATPDGAIASADAPAAYESARSKARAAARSLASMAAGKAATAREAAADSLSSLILASGIGAKAAAGLDAYLAGKSKSLSRLFPEAIELGSQLRKAGASGAREAAAATARREPESVVRSLISSKARLLALSPASAGAIARLESASAAYRAWMGSFPIAAYPGDLGSAADEERSTLAASVLAMNGLGAARAASLISAMSALGGRDAAAAEAASRLAEAWASSPAARRRDLAGLCGLSESSLACFASIASTAGETAAAVGAASPLAQIAALNGLEIAIADEEGLGSARPSGPEPALLLLEGPGLASVAKAEARYAGLLAECSRRLESLYAQAAEGAQARLEASALVAKAATLALGAAPAGIVARSIDLGSPPGRFDRRIAFFAVATDATGKTISLPLGAELAGNEYSAAFARAAGLRPSSAAPTALLAKYGQVIVSAYDPEGSKDFFAVDQFPRSPGSAGEAGRLVVGRLVVATDLELALLGAWRP